MKLSKAQIKMIRENTPNELKGRQDLPTLADFGYFMPMGANWSYRAVYVNYNGLRVLVVKQFGEII